MFDFDTYQLPQIKKITAFLARIYACEPSGPFLDVTFSQKLQWKVAPYSSAVIWKVGVETGDRA